MGSSKRESRLRARSHLGSSERTKTRTTRPRGLNEAICHTITSFPPLSPVYIRSSHPSFPFFPSAAMSSPPSIPRPPSRSQRLLRDTLRKDDTLRTHGPHTSRSRSNSSHCDEDEDDNIFESAILRRRSSRRNSAASALSHGRPTGLYVPDQDEHASYSRLLRSPSHSGSSRSGHSGRRSPPRPAYTQEKQDELSRHHDAAPHEAVLRSRLDSVMHSMGIDTHTDALDVSSCFTEPGSYVVLHDRR